jgi:hypothetical protein
MLFEGLMFAGRQLTNRVNLLLLFWTYLLQVDEQLFPNRFLIKVITEDLDFLILLSVMAGLLTVTILAVAALNWRGKGRRLESQDWLLQL